MFNTFSSRKLASTDLDALAHAAAAKYTQGQVDSMNDAVVSVVKEAHLNVEQIRRVVEMANTTAYLAEFNKEGTAHRVVHFEKGPADPSYVVKACAAGPAPVEKTAGLNDYHRSPSELREAEMAKTASNDSAFWQHFGGSPSDYGDDPLTEVIALRHKLAGEADVAHSQINQLESIYHDAAAHIYDFIKQATLEGHNLGDLVAFSLKVIPEEHTKMAFEMAIPRLVEERVLSDDDLVRSLEKRAFVDRNVQPNMDHPLVPPLAAFAESLDKLAETREYYQTLLEGVAELDEFMKEANEVPVADMARGFLRQHGGIPGLVSKGWGAATGATKALAPKVEGVVGDLAGTTRGGKAVASLAGKAVKFAPHAAAGLAGLAAYKQLSNNQTLKDTAHDVARMVPGTSAWDNHSQGIRAGIGDPYYAGGMLDVVPREARGLARLYASATRSCSRTGRGCRRQRTHRCWNHCYWIGHREGLRCGHKGTRFSSDASPQSRSRRAP